MINKGLLLIISGPAGVGKGTIVNYLVEGESNYFKSVSATSRKPRYMEREGEDYYFVTRAEFMRRVKRGEMLEYTEYNGNYYGTPLPPMKAHFEAGENVVLEIETDGAFQVKSKMPDAVLIFICPPSYEQLEARLRGRNTETEEAIIRRLSTARHELSLMPKYDYIIVNEDGKSDLSAQYVREIVRAEQLSSKRGIPHIILPE
ncbi:MAG: guanylate kinase [Clostridia bacterium]|jgi:guanylate kinase|nr:guanylate kinase [Clostridia bacterium]MBO7401136.1 guanylate kinase [Clostridia bacterium]MBQ6182832.1 guanylate kinase [Clostridia bacterium]